LIEKMDLAYTIRFIGSFNPKERKRFVPDEIHKEAHLHRSAPRYAAIESKIMEAIDKELLPAGVVVTEDPIARLFGTSRTPVRMAFNKLERLGFLERFEGRGFIVAGAHEPKRIVVTHQMLGLDKALVQLPQPMTAQRIAQAFEASIAQALPFGLYRVNEQAAADHFNVSRTIIRELLSRFQDRGLLRKDLRSHWVVGPLTAQDVAHYFAIRAKLEPLALMESAPLLPQDLISRMHVQAHAAKQMADDLALGELDGLETDLHVTLLAKTPNPHLRRMIYQSQIALSVNQVFAETVGTKPFSLALMEHCIVFEFLIRGSRKAAADALEEHLHLSAARTRKRLMAFSVFPEPDLPDYLRRISN
jgi:DNA-binding GntR family transcriptional regulator